MHNQPRFTERQLRVMRAALISRLTRLHGPSPEYAEVDEIIETIDEVLS